MARVRYIERIYQNSNPCRLKLFCWYSWKGKSLKITKFQCSLLSKENFLNSKRHKVVRLKYQIRNNLKLEGLSLLHIRVFIVHLYKKHAIRSFVIFLSMTNMTLNFPYKKWSFSSYCFLQYCDVDFLSIKKISNVKLHDGCKQKISKSFCFSTHTWIIIMDKSNGISGIRLSRKSMKGNTL